MQKHDIITVSGSGLPETVRRLHKVPKALHFLGNKELLGNTPRVGIIGARKYTSYGNEVTVKFATALAREGVAVVSGLAIGIDGLAHRACLEAGGKTIAVLPSGLKSIYPARHHQLAGQIIEKNGLLISEYEHLHRPKLYTFLERNRIIAALSDILIITEAAADSGSLNTASYALEMGIPIMAIPGNITSPNSAGTNSLIRAGAHPLLEPEDVLSLLDITPAKKIAYIPESEAEQAILDAISANITSTNEIIDSTNLPMTYIQTSLTLLEMRGIIAVQGGYWYIK